MGVPGGRERGFEDGVGVARSSVPKENLAGVGAADEKIGVEGGKGDGKDVRLRASKDQWETLR